jgi:hypothetical protein
MFKEIVDRLLNFPQRNGVKIDFDLNKKILSIRPQSRFRCLSKFMLKNEGEPRLSLTQLLLKEKAMGCCLFKKSLLSWAFRIPCDSK